MLTSSYHLPPFRGSIASTLVLFAGQSFRTSSSRYRGSQACTMATLQYASLSGAYQAMDQTGAILARSQ